MMRTQFRRIVPLAAFLAVGWASAGRAQEAGKQTGKKVGERLDQYRREIEGGLGRAGEAAKERFGKAKTSVHNMGVESRVYGRLHWDKALEGATIELTASDQGVITLSGSVADAAAKARAVDLASQTIGVTKVVDTLAIRPPAATTRP